MIARLLTRADEAAGGRALDAALYALAGLFALITALSSTLMPHRAWGSVAAWGYLAALVVTPFVNRLLLTWATFAAVSLLPLVIQAVQRAGGRLDRAQEEVLVVEEMGRGLASTGSPYLGRADIAALPTQDQLHAYHPYQPGMAVFGLPRAWLGDHWYTDSRVWFAVVMVAAVAWAAALVMTARSAASLAATSPSAAASDGRVVRAVQAATIFPVCALTLATGGDDMPVLALCLLAIAFCARDRFGAAGLAVGAAAALKLFAFPVVIVLAVLAVVTGRWRRFLPGAIGLPALVLVPPLLIDADSFVENVIRFPLGLGLVASPAQSPFPGYLIASSAPGGRYVAAVLLVLAGLAIAALLLRRPPRTAASAALFCGYGLLVAILLMPTTRFGYLLYPIAFLVWAAALSRPTGATAPRDDEALYRQ